MGQMLLRGHRPGEDMGRCGELSTFPLVRVRGVPLEKFQIVTKKYAIFKQNMSFYIF